MTYNFNPNRTFTYDSYLNEIDRLLTENKTTGENHSEAMLEYAILNRRRMKRLDKTIKINPELLAGLNKLNTPIQMIAITEGWCGDAAQNLPIFNALASHSEHLSLSLVLRDENLDIMDAFLTNRGRAIPKVIFLDQNNRVLFSWGPRPAVLSPLLTAYKAGDIDYTRFNTELHSWYAKDKTQTLQMELLKQLNDHVKS